MNLEVTHTGNWNEQADSQQWGSVPRIINRSAANTLFVAKQKIGCQKRNEDTVGTVAAVQDRCHNPVNGVLVEYQTDYPGQEKDENGPGDSWIGLNMLKKSGQGYL